MRTTAVLALSSSLKFSHALECRSIKQSVPFPEDLQLKNSTSTNSPNATSADGERQHSIDAGYSLQFHDD
jgi:hypothetical protein